MYLKSLLTASALTAAMITAPLSQAAPVGYDIDMSHTNVLFDVNHLGLSTMIGRFGDVAGTLMFDEDNIENSTVSVTVQTASINTFHEKRDDHLRSPDFFNTLEFPEMTFNSTSVTKLDANTAQLKGELTLLGVTQPVTLDLTVNKVGPHPFNKKQVAGFTATGTIKRSDFGMKYGAPMIGDDIALRLELEGIRQ
ncbi:YceI family protein [Aliamphritea spongicola]|uniref:YceI family protein n=1 Tax=Aliamphritea spongicola TaxID=707589 RepID=UPI00196A3431|nr:YceI family protein [Aliamphritea spongicola]MBN3560806.1 YceI family protein [Aliamphritea spongicola]